LTVRDGRVGAGLQKRHAAGAGHGGAPAFERSGMVLAATKWTARLFEARGHLSRRHQGKKMTTRISLCRQLLAFSLAVAAAQSFAQTSPARSEPRNQFEVGAWAVRHSQTLRAESLFGGATTPPDSVSLENDLGLSRRSTAFTVGYTRLIGQAWHFNAEYARSSRNGSTSTTRRLQIGDLSYPTGTTLQSDANIIYSSFAGGLALVQRDAAEFGVRVGGVTVRGRVGINDPSRNLKVDWIVSDVLPMVGLFIHTRPSENLRFNVRLDAAAQDGARTTNLQLDLRWQPAPSLGLSAGLRVLSGRSGRDDFDIYNIGRERSTYRLSGPQLSAHLAF